MQCGVVMMGGKKVFFYVTFTAGENGGRGQRESFIAQRTNNLSIASSFVINIVFVFHKIHSFTRDEHTSERRHPRVRAPPFEQALTAALAAALVQIRKIDTSIPSCKKNLLIIDM